MSDLTERLRKGVQDSCYGTWNISEADDLMKESADEIDRLARAGFAHTLEERLQALAVSMQGESPHVINDVKEASSLVGLKPKPLMWAKDGEKYCSKTPIGEYVVGMVGDHYGWVNNGLTGWHFSTSVECAKVECQTDYEQRIKEVLG